MIITKKSLHRRTFLRGLGAAVALPLLDSMVPAFASPARIDRDNILRASLWALARAVHALPEMPKHVFVDGRDKLDTSCDCDAVIGGGAGSSAGSAEG